MGKSSINLNTNRPFIMLVCIPMCILGGFYILQNTLSALSDPYTSTTDLASFYNGWSMMANHKWSTVYDITAQFAYQTPVDGVNRLAPIYIHPPHSAFPFVWLTYVSLPTAYMIWMLLNYGFLTIFLWQLWIHMLKDWPINMAWGFLTLIIGLPPLFVNLMVGNLSILMALIILNIWLGIKQNRLYKVGFLLFFGTIKPQLIIIIGLYILGRRIWKSVAVAVGALLLAICITVFVMGIDIWKSYFMLVQDLIAFWGENGIFPMRFYNPRSTFANIFGESGLEMANLLSTILYIGYAIVAYIIGLRSRMETRSWEIAVITLGSIYFSPHLYVYDLLIVTVALAFMYDFMYQQMYSKRIVWMGIVLSMIMVLMLYAGSPNESSVLLNLLSSLTLLPLLIYMWMLLPSNMRFLRNQFSGTREEVSVK